MVKTQRLDERTRVPVEAPGQHRWGRVQMLLRGQVAPKDRGSRTAA